MNFVALRHAIRRLKLPKSRLLVELALVNWQVSGKPTFRPFGMSLIFNEEIGD